jgi:hypothetical protein
MNDAENSIESQGARSPCVNVEAPEKPVGSFNAKRTNKAVKAVESQESVRKQREEKLDLWMENIKEFIRNIDVKSL